MSSEFFYLVLNIVLFVGILVRDIRKNGFSAASLIVCIYLTLSVFSLILYLGGGNYSLTGRHVSIVSVLFFFVSWIVCFSPIAKQNFHSLPSDILHPNEAALNVFLVFLIIVGLSNIIPLIANLDNLSNALFDSDYFNNAYMEKSDSFKSDETVINAGFHVFPILRYMSSEITIFFTMYYFSYPRRKKWILCGLLLTVLLMPLTGAISASRGYLTSTVSLIFFFWLMFRAHYSERVRKISRILIIVVGVLIVVVIGAITISRFTRYYMSEDYLRGSLISYLGSPILNFEQSALDANGIRNGDRILTLFKYAILPNGGAYSFSARLSKYSHMILDESVFTTFIGDIVLDFGPFFSLLFISLISIIIYRASPSRNQPFDFYKMIPLVSCIILFLGGWHLCPYAEVGGNLKIIFYYLVYLYFRFIPREKLSQG